MFIPAYQQLAEIIRAEELASDICRFTMKAPKIAVSSRPGQFVMVRVGDGLDPLLRRPFSIHQVAEGGVLQVLFKIIGKGTQALAMLQPGQHMDLLGPLGRGFSIAENQQHCLIGGGIGIAPLLFLAKKILKKSEPSSVKVLLGARTKDELAPLEEDFANMGLDVQVATEDGTLGKRGLVTDLMVQLHHGDPVTVYTCGPHPMLQAVVQLCRSNKWNCQVSLEAMMACGLAACLGCAVLRPDLRGYAHVCKDGPVFDADEVAWL